MEWWQAKSAVFMTNKELNAWQFWWTEFLTWFYFLIRYRPGRENTLADALGRPTTGVHKKDEYRQQIILKINSVEQLLETDGPEVNTLDPSLYVVDQILKANRESTAEEYREKSQEGVDDWNLQDSLLMKGNRLFFPNDDPELCTWLLDEVHAQVSTAHPGSTETQQLIKARYYWPTWRRDIERYIYEPAWSVEKLRIHRDRAPGLLQPMPIAERPWQHIAMDFRSFPPDKNDYDMALVIVNRFSKRHISIEHVHGHCKSFVPWNCRPTPYLYFAAYSALYCLIRCKLVYWPDDIFATEITNGYRTLNTLWLDCHSHPKER